MKLFFLIIPFLGIQCLSEFLSQEKTEAIQPVQASSYEMLPHVLLFEIN